jgi:hypothetical protein
MAASRNAADYQACYAGQLLIENAVQPSLPAWLIPTLMQPFMHIQSEKTESSFWRRAAMAGVDFSRLKVIGYGRA